MDNIIIGEILNIYLLQLLNIFDISVCIHRNIVIRDQKNPFHVHFIGKRESR